MSVNVTIQEVNGVSVVGLNGRIVLGEESAALREASFGVHLATAVVSGRYRLHSPTS
jgi:hypothetical protein